MTAHMHAVDQWKHQTVPWKHAMCTEAAVEVTSRSMEHSGKQQIIATVLWKCRLVAAIQQLYKLLYKSCIEAKQNNAQVYLGVTVTALLAPAHLSNS